MFPRVFKQFFGLKYLNFFMWIRDPGILLTLDPGSEMEKIRIRDKHPGSATFAFNVLRCHVRYSVFMYCGVVGKLPTFKPVSVLIN
jgi:hypothetical protein